MAECAEAIPELFRRPIITRNTHDGLPILHLPTATMPVYSLAPFVSRRPWLLKMLQPVANWYANTAGYRQVGLRYASMPSALLRMQ